MRLKRSEIDVLTMLEFNLMYEGYLAREEREWNRTRHLMSFIQTFSGFGANEFADPKKIIPLRMDREDEKKYIKTLKQCLELINEFEQSINGSKVRS